MTDAARVALAIAQRPVLRGIERATLGIEAASGAGVAVVLFGHLGPPRDCCLYSVALPLCSYARASRLDGQDIAIRYQSNDAEAAHVPERELYVPGRAPATAVRLVAPSTFEDAVSGPRQLAFRIAALARFSPKRREAGDMLSVVRCMSWQPPVGCRRDRRA